MRGGGGDRVHQVLAGQPEQIAHRHAHALFGEDAWSWAFRGLEHDIGVLTGLSDLAGESDRNVVDPMASGPVSTSTTRTTRRGSTAYSGRARKAARSAWLLRSTSPAAFAAAVAELGAVWLSLEGAGVLADVSPPAESQPGFVLVRDGHEVLATADAHATWLAWTTEHGTSRQG